MILFLSYQVWHHITHPLYRFPGPRFAAWSNVLYSKWFFSGKQPFHLLRLHEKYGPVVRTGPNELSFNTASSWRDIYAFRQGHHPFIKSSFYDGGSFANQAYSIVTARDPAEHAVMRRYLAHAFSERSLKEQEVLVAEQVDELMSQFGQNGKDGLDIVKWFELAAFDIIGSLAFGQSFNGLQSGNRVQLSPHKRI